VHGFSAGEIPLVLRRIIADLRGDAGRITSRDVSRVRLQPRYDRAQPQSEREDTNDDEHQQTRGQKQLEIVLGVPTRVIGATAKMLVEQIEIDRAPVPNAVE
jgi:hypothetical protein